MLDLGSLEFSTSSFYVRVIYPTHCMYRDYGYITLRVKYALTMKVFTYSIFYKLSMMYRYIIISTRLKMRDKRIPESHDDMRKFMDCYIARNLKDALSIRTSFTPTVGNLFYFSA